MNEPSAPVDMTGSERYVIVGVFDAIDSHIDRTRWPAHVTFASNFVSSASLADLMGAVWEVVRGRSTLTIEFGAQDLFGPHADMPVQLVVPGAANEIHDALAERLGALPGFRADVPAYWRAGYRPHVTLGPSFTAEEGTERRVTGVVLARLDGDTATVLGSVPVGDLSLHVRRATLGDARALARLKVGWAFPDRDLPDSMTAGFAVDLRRWMRDQRDALVVMIALDGDTVVGMAWMVIFSRVPDFDDRRRLTADIQSVYVAPGWRGMGVGTRLVNALCREAVRRRIPRTMVTASARSVSLYRRAGFRQSPLLLQRVDGASEEVMSEPEGSEPIEPA